MNDKLIFLNSEVRGKGWKTEFNQCVLNKIGCILCDGSRKWKTQKIIGYGKGWWNYKCFRFCSIGEADSFWSQNINDVYNKNFESKKSVST